MVIVNLTLNTNLTKETINRIGEEVAADGRAWLDAHGIWLDGVDRRRVILAAFNEGATSAFKRLIAINCEISKGGDDGGKA